MKKSEKVLLGIFLSLLFAAASWGLWLVYASKLDQLKEEAHQLAVQEAEVEVLLKQKDMWLKRAHWLQQAQPEFTSWEDVDIQLLEDAQAKGVKGVTTSEHRLMDPVENTYYRQTGVRFRVQGSLPDVFSWLYQLQSPENFRVVNMLKVVPNREDTKIVECEVELLRWYEAPSS